MDWCIQIDILISLLTLALQLVAGFTITGHASHNRHTNKVGQQHPGIDYDREFPSSLPYAVYADDGVRGRHHRRQTFDLPDDAFLFKAISSLASSDDNGDNDVDDDDDDDDDNSTPQFLSSPVANNYDNAPANDNDNVDDDGDDHFNVIATISYPANMAPSLDNLPLSSKLGLLAVPSKRQQGWYVQYGKRTPPNTHSGKQTASHHRSENYVIKTASGSSKERHKPTKSDTGSDQDLNNFRFNFKLGENFDQLEDDVKTRDMAFDIIRRILEEKTKDVLQPPSAAKRQQGWFTQYGKRSSEKIGNVFS